MKTRIVSMFNFWWKFKYIRFFFTGASGVFINLLVTWLLTEFVFGLENYFYGYLIGLGANLVYNFVLHTYLTFHTKKHHKSRFALFIVYTLLLSIFQAFIVKSITDFIGNQYYLIVIAAVILILSTATYFFFRYILFKEK